jgi:hypothetical protein
VRTQDVPAKRVKRVDAKASPFRRRQRHARGALDLGNRASGKTEEQIACPGSRPRQIRSRALSSPIVVLPHPGPPTMSKSPTCARACPCWIVGFMWVTPRKTPRSDC